MSSGLRFGLRGGILLFLRINHNQQLRCWSCSASNGSTNLRTELLLLSRRTTAKQASPSCWLAPDIEMILRHVPTASQRLANHEYARRFSTESLSRSRAVQRYASSLLPTSMTRYVCNVGIVDQQHSARRGNDQIPRSGIAGHCFIGNVWLFENTYLS